MHGKSLFGSRVKNVLRYFIFLELVVSALASGGALKNGAGELSAQARVGERLFAEPRFAQFFQMHGGGKVNSVLAAGDPALDSIAVSSVDGSVIKNPAPEQSLSCASCHFGAVDARPLGLPAKGTTIFGDFFERSPVSARSDKQLTTVRNTPPLVAALAGQGLAVGWGLLHWDGEFASIEDLVVGTYTGRNLGWLPTETREARRNFARVIREDDGRGILAGKYGHLSYAILLRGADAAIPDELRLPSSFRFDPANATDEEILQGGARLVAAYVASLHFSEDQDGRYNGSPYDAFLAANYLPRAPEQGESPPEYSRRLHAAVAALRAPRFIDDPTRKLELHDQAFRFGELELRGMKLFFRGTLGYARTASAGNCAECHVPPHFTDFSFHNTGEAQDSYDAVHGLGAFARLAVPSLTERQRAPDRWLPASAVHPQGSGILRSPALIESIGSADLGLWNVYGNADLPAPQSVIERKLNHEGRLSGDEVLALTLGRFKTPTLRDLGQSAPHFHTGRMRTVDDVVNFYLRMSELARAGKMRNAPPEFLSMSLNSADIEPLVAFLRSLNEDYSKAAGH